MDAPYAKLDQIEPDIARVLAHNPSAFTYYGTQTYLVGESEVAVIDPGPYLPEHTIVYHTSIMQDAAGTHFIDASQAVPMVAGAANAPVFAVDDVDVGNGTVGGYVLSFAADGR